MITTAIIIIGITTFLALLAYIGLRESGIKEERHRQLGDYDYVPQSEWTKAKRRNRQKAIDAETTIPYAPGFKTLEMVEDMGSSWEEIYEKYGDRKGYHKTDNNE